MNSKTVHNTAYQLLLSSFFMRICSLVPLLVFLLKSQEEHILASHDKCTIEVLRTDSYEFLHLYKSQSTEHLELYLVFCLTGPCVCTYIEPCGAVHMYVPSLMKVYVFYIHVLHRM